MLLHICGMTCCQVNLPNDLKIAEAEYTQYTKVYNHNATSPGLGSDSLRGSSDKIGTIQRRLAWPLRKDDTQNREAFHIFAAARLW